MKYYKQKDEERHAVKEDDSVAYCTAEDKLREILHGIEMTTEYNYSHVEEDKTNTSRDLLDGHAMQIYSTRGHLCGVRNLCSFWPGCMNTIPE